MNRTLTRHKRKRFSPIHTTSQNDTGTCHILNMDIKYLPMVRKMSTRYLSKIYQGVDIKKLDKGVELVCQGLNTFSSWNKYSELSILPVKREKRSSDLCVFFDALDYLAYLSLQENMFVRVPSGCDSLIMSDVRNFLQLAIEADDYGKIYLFFPNDVTGITITRTLKDRYGKCAVPYNSLYKGYSNLMQFAKAIEHPKEYKQNQSLNHSLM